MLGEPLLGPLTPPGHLSPSTGRRKSGRHGREVRVGERHTFPQHKHEHAPTSTPSPNPPIQLLCMGSGVWLLGPSSSRLRDASQPQGVSRASGYKCFFGGMRESPAGEDLTVSMHF